MKSPLRCLICKQTSLDIKNLEDHFKTHNLSEVHRFPCHLCNLKFLMFSTLTKHLQLVHLQQPLSQDFLDSEEYKSLEQDAEAEFNKHSKVDVKDSHLILNDFLDFEDDNLDSDVEDDRDDFKEQDSVAKSNDEKESSLVDNTADESSSTKNLPEKGAKKSFKCNVEGCFKTFHHLTSFIMHGKCVHSDERSFTCEICSKSFKTRSNLNVHIKMHNNQRDHSCTMCSLSFFTSSHLKAHLKVHLKETSYICEVPGCGKEFIHSSSFKKHKDFHNGIKKFQCNICERKFSQACHLREHLKIHSNERLHKCKECDKAFRRPDTLRIHQRTHKR